LDYFAQNYGGYRFLGLSAFRVHIPSLTITIGYKGVNLCYAFEIKCNAFTASSLGISSNDIHPALCMTFAARVDTMKHNEGQPPYKSFHVFLDEKFSQGE
jgi:hypothetical protein